MQLELIMTSTNLPAENVLYSGVVVSFSGSQPVAIGVILLEIDYLHFIAVCKIDFQVYRNY